MATKKLQLLGTLGNKVYTQNEEPTDAIDGSLWVDLDEEGTGGTSGVGGSLPTVSTSDNGKFLRVVDGAWMAVDMQDVSEVGL